MNILCIGDVVGSAGCGFLRRHLPAFKKAENIGLVIANGENSADGNGITPFSAEHLFTSGVDVITTGNHVFKRKEIYGVLEENPRIVRPANYPDQTPGRGYTVVDTAKLKICVVNLMGTVFLDSLSNPFYAADEIISKAGEGAAVIVDFHAEATSEKKALAFYLDGRAAAVYGTHTHVQTADECLLPKGTAYISDIGMTGPEISILGVDPALVVRRFVTKMPVRFMNAQGSCFMSGIIIDIDDKTLVTKSIKKIQLK